MVKRVSSYLNRFYDVIIEIPSVRFIFGFIKYIHNGLLAKSSTDVVVLSHFGLGDQLIIGRLLNSLALKRTVILPVDSKYFVQLKTYYAYNPNIRIEEIGFLKPEYYPRKSDLKKMHNSFQCPVIDVGRNVIYFLSFLYRKSGVSKLYYQAAWNDGISFLNIPAYRYHFKEHAIETSDRGYAFIDHHVGTNREIPNQVFLTIRNSGLDLKFNDMTLTLIDQLTTIVKARELHLVASAPFCLALAMPCTASVRVFYESRNVMSVLGDEGSGWERSRCI